MHAVSSHKDTGVRDLLAALHRAAGGRGDIWVVSTRASCPKNEAVWLTWSVSERFTIRFACLQMHSMSRWHASLAVMLDFFNAG